MRKLILSAFIFLLGVAASVGAQTPAATPAPAGAAADSAIKPNLAVGEITAVDSAGNKISLRTNDGAIDVVLSPATVYKRIPPETPRLTAAVDAALSDMSVGDKVLVTGKVAADKKSVPAKAVYLMTKADIGKRNAAESQAWRTRGVSGRVVSLNPNKEEFTIAARGMAGEQNIVVSAKENVNYRRYAPNSVKFDDAQKSSFSELKIGDQVRALGDKSADNTAFQAERIVFGSFKMVGGTITAIDAAKNEITIKELQTNKPITIAVNNASTLKKFPAEMATMMATRMSGGGMQPSTGAGAGGAAVVVMRPSQQGTQPAANQGQGAPPNGTMRGGSGAGAGAGMRGGNRGEVDDLLERFPTISLGDLKVGDAIAISSTASADANRYTAIKLVAGVEPFFKAPQMAAGGQRGGNQPQINIPGLDGGFGTP